jgi:hypothetical protein
MDRLFDIVHRQLQGEPNRRGFYNADCPFCGKPAKPGQNHFGYSYDGRTQSGRYNCFVCSARGSLAKLADHLLLDTGGYAPIHRVPEPELKPVARWRSSPDTLLDRYRNHLHRFDAWRRYKPLMAQTIARFDFGLGRLPFQREDGSWYLSHQEWLTVQLWEDGQLVGLRGRNRTQSGPKWISATGTAYTLWGVDFVRPGAVTWLCENYVDAAWLMQEHPDWCAVAIGGATTWKPEWADMLAARKPDTVIVALDNDLPGQATGTLRRKLERAWIQQRGTEPPPANGPKIANALQRAGVPAVLFKWPDAAPVKAGLDWVLEQRIKEAA